MQQEMKKNLRDEFALAAMPTFLEDALIQMTDSDQQLRLTEAALKSYAFADAMLMARNTSL